MVKIEKKKEQKWQNKKRIHYFIYNSWKVKAMALIVYYRIMLHFECKLTQINYVDKNIKKCYYKYDDICELSDEYQI